MKLGGYVAQDSDLEQVPEDIVKPPSEPGYMMRLICGNDNYDNPGYTQKQIAVDLPATEEELDTALEKLGIPNWDKIII